ncbi:ShlB/FhaC/HecB family hemolysin secretion/activation protein [Xenorhabdus nematophila]|uniref:ShlB/FhaC/HecB family hemolysin secretion/activation protein n=1 Tax=Xenorhabdus nematophila TaxID=628 RepID=UPI002D218361|nr:ShlB/FhaC/HecB family hemolysin secretion/activation protein [Xenorhabdus nematophila]
MLSYFCSICDCITYNSSLKKRSRSRPVLISKGNLTIIVVEGKVDNILMDGENALDLKMAFPNMIGKILNLRDIEQGLEQLNRMSSYQVRINIKPSKKTGYSDIILTKKYSKSPISISFGLDNDGNKHSGENQINTNLRLDNILNLADLWTFYANKDTDFSHDHKTWYIISGVSIPYGYWLFNYQHVKNETRQNITIENFKYPYKVKGESHNLRANRTLYRDGRQKLGFNIGLTKRKTENIIGNIKLLSSSDLSTFNIGLNYIPN